MYATLSSVTLHTSSVSQQLTGWSSLHLCMYVLLLLLLRTILQTNRFNLFFEM